MNVFTIEGHQRKAMVMESLMNDFPSGNHTSDIVPITIETKYIPFGSNYFKDEEITPAQFDEALESNLGKLKSFINMKIIEGKTTPKAEMLFDF